jgi:trehalose 6-phosphate phosphatase
LTPEVELEMQALLRAVSREPRSLLLLDYDGTLAPFRKQRDRAFPYPGVVPVLERIIANGRTRVVIISGRDASEAYRLLGIAGVEIWGLHGSQRLRLDGQIETPPPQADVLDALSAADHWLNYQQLRHLAEFKTGSIAVHWRDLGERQANEIRDRVLLGWMHIAQDTGLELMEFDGGVEIRKQSPHKGDAVRVLLNEMGPDIPAAYLGDDRTDERAFAAIQGHGLSVLVRHVWRRTEAQLWLNPPTELLSFLERWLKACEEPEGSNHEAAAAVNG